MYTKAIRFHRLYRIFFTSLILMVGMALVFPIATKPAFAASSNKPIKCNLSANGKKNKNMSIKWSCSNTVGWTCVVTDPKGSFKKSAVLPKGSISIKARGTSEFFVEDKGKTISNANGTKQSTHPLVSGGWTYRYGMKCVSASRQSKSFFKPYSFKY